MTRDEIAQAVLEAIGEWRGPQSTSHLEIDDRTCPVGGVEGFDSIAGIAATIHLEQQLGLSDLRDNVFLSPDGKGAQSLSEIVDELHALRTAPEED